MEKKHHGIYLHDHQRLVDAVQQPSDGLGDFVTNWGARDDGRAAEPGSVAGSLDFATLD